MLIHSCLLNGGQCTDVLLGYTGPDWTLIEYTNQHQCPPPPMHQPPTSPIYQMHWDSPTPPPKCITSFYCCTQFDPQPLFLLQLRLLTHDRKYLNRENENCFIKRRKSCSTFLSRGAAQCPHPARRTTSAFLVKKQNHNSRQRKNHETLIFMIFKSTDMVLKTILFCFRRGRTRQ